MSKVIIWSAVPLPCFFALLKSQKVAGQRPQQGTKSCRMGRNSVCPYVHPPVRPLFGWSNRPQSKGSECQLEGYQGLPEGSEGLPVGSEILPEGSEGLTEGSEGLSDGFGTFQRDLRA